MRQLNKVGWMHHLARHAVACFLTRGDLWLSWEQGRDVFDKLLIDADWSLNNMNWLALSGAAPWSPPFFRVYHPVPKMDSSLNVKDPEFIPELHKMPSKYIYAPWTAPLEDYPKPIVDHETASKANLARFKKALSSSPPTSAGHPEQVLFGSLSVAFQFQVARNVKPHLTQPLPRGPSGRHDQEPPGIISFRGHALIF
eukprot:symbB.v1.2.031430.t1/scaffold3635.1/size52935/8